ncbi:MAG TPA: hypothetical protein PLN69_01490 [bacterium]|nr:hypothetical protein [bacterium]
MKLKFFYFTCIIVAVLLCCAQLSSAEGTISGTIIFATASIKSDNSIETTSSTQTTVLPMYGIEMNYGWPDDSSASSGGNTLYNINFENNGNATDEIRINVGEQTFGAGSGITAEWAVEVDTTEPFTGITWANSNTQFAHASGDYATASLAPGEVATFTLRVTTSGSALDSSTMSAMISLETTSSPGGSYVGFNGLSYGGSTMTTRITGAGPYFTTQVLGAAVALTKSYTVASPSEYQALGGSATATVPGAQVTYTIQFENNGALDAGTVTIVDPLPDYVDADTASLQLDTGSGFVQMAPGTGDGDQCDYNVSVSGAVTCFVNMPVGTSGRIRYYAVLR